MNQFFLIDIFEIESVVGEQVTQLHELRVEMVHCRSSSLRIICYSGLLAFLLEFWE